MEFFLDALTVPPSPSVILVVVFFTALYQFFCLFDISLVCPIKFFVSIFSPQMFSFTALAYSTNPSVVGINEKYS